MNDEKRLYYSSRVDELKRILDDLGGWQQLRLAAKSRVYAEFEGLDNGNVDGMLQCHANLRAIDFAYGDLLALTHKGMTREQQLLFEGKADGKKRDTGNDDA